MAGASRPASDLLVYFTDALGEFPEREPVYPVLWLVKGKATVPWTTRSAELEIMAVLELSNEDSLRLNVLVMNVEAVRIDERSMAVYGLSARGEARCNSIRRTVRSYCARCASSCLRTHSDRRAAIRCTLTAGRAWPGARPNLAKLLMLGENRGHRGRACVRRAHGGDCALRVWVDPSSENARRMLARECVVQSDMAGIGRLPHRTPAVRKRTARHHRYGATRAASRADRAGCTSAPVGEGAAQSVYRIGFLEAEPDSLPQPLPARADLETLRPALTKFAASNNPLALLLLRTLDSPGQTFAATCEQVLHKLSSQEAVVAVLNALSRYFLSVRSSDQPTQDIALILEEAASRLDAWSAARSFWRWFRRCAHSCWPCRRLRTWTRHRDPIFAHRQRTAR